MAMVETYRLVFLMDQYKTLNLETETSLLLMERLRVLGHQVYWLELDGLYLDHANVRGRLQKVSSVSPLVLSEQKDVALDSFHGLLVRIDPPVSSRYLHMTYILDHLNSSVAQFNDVASLRELNEKLLPLRWPALVPPSVVTSDEQDVRSFLAEHQHIVLKPLDDCSGRGIVSIKQSEDDVKLSDMMLNEQGEARYVLAQKFLPNIALGDKRVYLSNGEVIGYVNRVPKKGEFLANIHQGASCHRTTLTSKEREAVEMLRPYLMSKGLVFVGIDFIDGYVTEINITSPSAIRQINHVMEANVQETMVANMLDVIRVKQEKRAGKINVCCGMRWVA